MKLPFFQASLPFHSTQRLQLPWDSALVSKSIPVPHFWPLLQLLTVFHTHLRISATTVNFHSFVYISQYTSVCWRPRTCLVLFISIFPRKDSFWPAVGSKQLCWKNELSRSRCPFMCVHVCVVGRGEGLVKERTIDITDQLRAKASKTTKTAVLRKH